MLAIKLQRVGKKHQPSYRLVVAEKRSKLGGPPVEDLGSYNPLTKELKVDSSRVKYWVGIGAKPTVTAHNLLVEKKVLDGAKMAVKMKAKEESAGTKTESSGATGIVAEVPKAEVSGGTETAPAA